jgi:hypothetical protein
MDCEQNLPTSTKHEWPLSSLRKGTGLSAGISPRPRRQAVLAELTAIGIVEN